MAGRDDDIIAETAVKVSPDLTGFRAKLLKDLDKATKGVTAKVKVVADATGLRDSVRAGVAKQMALANQPVYKVKVVADMQGFGKSLQQVGNLERQARNSRKTGEAANDQAIARDRIRTATAAIRTVERAEKAAGQRRQKIQRELFSGPKLIDYGGAGIKPTNLLLGVVTALSPALLAMSASAIQASTSIAALGSAGVGAALGLSGVMVAFQGIGDMLSLRKQVLAESTNAAANAATSADDAARASRALADAQRDEKQALDDIHKARREAVRDLEDLKQAVIDLDNQYKSDTLSVAEARDRAQATDRNFFASALDRARAWQDVRDAETRLSDTALQRKQKREDLRQSVSKGVEGSDKVRDAKERARDARDRVLDARAATRTAGGFAKTSSAAAQLAQKIKEMSPAARQMYYWFEKNEGLFKRLQRQISQKVLPGFNTFLEAIQPTKDGRGNGKSTLQLAAQYAGELGAIISKYAGKLGQWTQSPLFRESMARIQKTNAAAFDKLGQALLALADPITRILDKAAPGFEALADTILRLSNSFATWIETLDENGGLDKWFRDSRTELGKWYRIAGNILGLLKNIFTAALPAGGSLVSSFEEFTKSLLDWSNTNQASIRAFFDGVAKLPYAQLIDFFKNAATFFVAFRAFKMLKSLNPLILALGAFASANPQAAAQAFATIGNTLANVLGFIASNPAAATTLLGLFAAWKGGKALGINLKLPVIDKLASKFKVLDQFVGGGATTGTMNVQAAVVNIYGGAGMPGLPGGKPGQTGKPSRILGGVEAVGVSNIVSAAVLFGATTGWEEFQRGLGKDKRAFAAWKDIFKDGFDLDTIFNTFIDNSAITMFTVLGRKWAPAIGHFFSMTLPNLLSGKTNGWAGVGTYLLEQLSMYGGDGILGGIIDGLTGNAYTEFKNKLAGWVSGIVDWVKRCLGIASPSTVFAAIGADLIAGLWSGFVGKWGELKKTIPVWIDANITQPLKAIFTTAGGLAAGGFASGFATLTKKLAGPAAAVLSWIDTHFINKINLLLTSLGAPNIPTLAGGAKDAGKGVGKIIGDIAKKTGAGHAGGGTVRGYSPTPTSDNIPAMLTANEYVQPVAAVKHYGTDFMDAVRTRRYPRYAAGGLVGELSGKYGKNLLTQIAGAAITRAGGSVASAASRLSYTPGSDQEYTGRTPRGLGDVSGLGNRMMAAVVATHAMFPWASVNSGYRAGARTVSGNRSYHSMRRATDWPASMELFNYFVSRYGKTAKEIIYSPAGNRQIWNGKRHMYTGAVRATHFDHVHLALADGGLVPARKYDTGGILPPGYSTVYNGTGRNETVRTEKQERALAATTRLDRRDLALLAQYMAGASGPPQISMDGRKVAETTNRYNYLPAGV